MPIKISQLPIAATVLDTDIIPIVQGGVTKSSTLTVIKELLSLFYTKQTDLAAPSGASLVGFDGTLNYAAGTIGHSVSGIVIDVTAFPWLAVGDGTTDDYAAIQAAINNLNATNKGGEILLPRQKRFRCTHMLAVPWSGSGIIIRGAGGVDQSGDGVSGIFGDHTEDAILSLQGSVFCQANNLYLDGGLGATFPKTALLLGRNGIGSAGWHSFNNLGIIGRFSVAAHYNVASEGNSYRDCWWALDAGSTASRVVYLSGGDGGGLNPVTTLTGSTLLGAEFNNCHLYHMGLTAAVSCIDIHGSVALGSIAFRGGYLVQANGHFVSIGNGSIDGQDTLGPITFDGVGGERPGGVGVPISGFNLYASAGAPVYLRGLNVRNCNFLMAAGNYIKQDQYVRLANAVILSQGINGSNPAALTFPSSVIGAQRYGLASVNAGECLNCLIDVGGGFRVEGTVEAVLTGAWSQTFSVGNGYGPVGYYKDITGHCRLVGAPDSGVSGTGAFTLPVGYRPLVNMAFSCLSNISTIAGQGDTRVDISSTTGVVTITGGTSPAFLFGINFPTF